MRVAYADPPYPGRSSRLCADQPDYAGELDSVELAQSLVAEYDAFALHTTTTALVDVLPVCPRATRVLAWCKSWASWKPNRSPAFAWEPVLIAGHRARDDSDKVRDFYVCPATTLLGFAGAKPQDVILWVFAALGLEAEDELVDLFPGTGAVGAAWEVYRRQARIDLRVPSVSPGQIELADPA